MQWLNLPAWTSFLAAAGTKQKSQVLQQRPLRLMVVTWPVRS